MKRLWLAFALLVSSTPAFAQLPAPPATGSASLTSTTCPGTGCVQLNVSGYASAAVQVTGTWVGTLTFEVGIDGANYQALSVVPTNSTTTATTTTGNGVWAASVAGQKYLRIRMSAYTSGTAVVTVQAALAGGGSGGGGGGGGSAPSGTIGAAVPATASPAAVKDNAGNLAYPNLDGSGNLLVAVTGAGSGGTSSVDGAAYVASTTAGTPAMGARDDAATTACAEDKVCIARLSSSRALLVDLSATAANSTKLLVTPDSVALPANQSVNVNQLAGTATSVNSGTKDAGTLRVVIATDQPALTNKLLVTPDSVALPANQSVNVSQVGGQTTLQGDQNNIASATGAQTVGALGRYNATQPTLTDTRFNLLQLSSRGSLFVTPGVDGFAVTGTVTTTPPSNASTNVAQFGGTNVSTGTGAGGAGIPRVTISNDSSLAANQSVNVAQVNGVTTSVDNGASGTGVQRVTIANNSTGTVGLNTGSNTIGSLTANQTVNLAQVAGTNTVTGGVAGLIAVAGNIANGVTATANPVPVGGVFTTAPTTLTTGQTATLQFTAAQNAKTDLTTIAGTAPTTAGKIDVKGADGDVFVRQATATNLKTQAEAYQGGAAVAAGNPLQVSLANTGTNATAVKVDGSAVTQPVSGTVTANQGTANSIANRWPVQLTDGTNRAAVNADGSESVNCVNCNSTVIQAPNGLKTAVLGLRLMGAMGQGLGDTTPLQTISAPIDPCLDPTRVGFVAISQAANAVLVTMPAAKRIFICHYTVVGADAENVSFVEGTGATCGTGTLAVIGGATAAAGMNFAANGGANAGDGVTGIARTAVLGNSLCLFQSGSGRVAGSLKYAFQ